MPFGIPRNEAARAKRHAEIYGEGELPPAIRKRLGPVMETLPEIIFANLPAPPIGPDGKWQPPLPRWLIVKMRGAGRRLPK
ncbi:unnamed protein product [marine sediment metagenome]|uniref:Uncharacterized protein n=1 Tax=marine sediment metagenome TaxID=412755 RepID=X1TQK3_9ZZZZ